MISDRSIPLGRYSRISPLRIAEIDIQLQPEIPTLWLSPGQTMSE